MITGSAKKLFKKGDILIREGDRGDCAYVIESGNVEILLQREGLLIQIGTRGPGALIGEMAMIDDKPRTATVRALEECRVIEISREDFSRRVDSADPVVKMIMHVINARYRDMIGRSHFGPTAALPPTENAEHSDKFHNIAIGTIKVFNELKAAVDNGELLLHYQPIISLQDLKITGFEALMRWRHAEKGMISPGIFIPIAEESDLIVDLSRFALNAACDAVKRLRAAANPALVGAEKLFISVNLPVNYVSDEVFLDELRDLFLSKAVETSAIHLEITESLLMQAPATVKIMMDKCHAQGISVSIDDFGTGYSSLAYLHSFHVDKLKIDQSFISSMCSNPASLILVKSIIALAHNLEMTIVAEGVETAEQATVVRKLGCEECQGYWFARPMPLEEALKFVQTWNPPHLA